MKTLFTILFLGLALSVFGEPYKRHERFVETYKLSDGKEQRAYEQRSQVTYTPYQLQLPKKHKEYYRSTRGIGSNPTYFNSVRRQGNPLDGLQERTSYNLSLPQVQVKNPFTRVYAPVKVATVVTPWQQLGTKQTRNPYITKVTDEQQVLRAFSVSHVEEGLNVRRSNSATSDEGFTLRGIYGKFNRRGDFKPENGGALPQPPYIGTETGNDEILTKYTKVGPVTSVPYVFMVLLVGVYAMCVWRRKRLEA